MHRNGGERRKVDNCIVDSRIMCAGKKTKNVVHIGFDCLLFFLIDRVMINC